MKNKVPPPVWLLAFGISMWFVARSGFAYRIDIPFALLIALAIGLLGVLCSAAGIRAFNKASTTVNPLNPAEASALVTTGIYRRTRNPMYVGLFLFLTGWAVWLSSPSNLVLLAGFVLVITELQIKPEEKALHEIFGEEYDAYRNRVRRWI